MKKIAILLGMGLLAGAVFGQVSVGVNTGFLGGNETHLLELPSPYNFKGEFKPSQSFLTLGAFVDATYVVLNLDYVMSVSDQTLEITQNDVKQPDQKVT